MNYLYVLLVLIVFVPLLIMAVVGTALFELDDEQNWHDTY